MGIEENKEVARLFIDGSHEVDSPVVDELASDDFVFHPLGSSVVYDKETYKRVLTYLSPAYKDYDVDFNNIVAENDMVMIRITVQATHVGKWNNTAPTGKRINVAEFFVFRMDNGKIAEMWVLRDNLSMYQQIGELPPNEEIGK